MTSQIPLVDMPDLEGKTINLRKSSMKEICQRITPDMVGNIMIYAIANQ